MQPIYIAIIVGVCVYVITVALMPKRFFKESSSYTRGMLEKLEILKSHEPNEDQLSVLREQASASGIMARIFMALPGSSMVYPGLIKAGLSNKVGTLFTYCLIVFAVSMYLLRSFGVLGFIGAAIITILFGMRYVRKQITKRNDAFLNFFPDALDMIVRSVRSGYPLTAAIRMVADNMQPPVSTEFKQLADEVAYGSTLIEALQRLSQRIDEQDVRFFVVVLSVQQDVGGNISEVLHNLSSIIRKRKYLRLKIRSLSSEGRATAWVLGSMPFVEAALIHFVSPDHLTPLFYTTTGHIFLAATLGVVGIGIFIIKQIVNIRV